LSDTGDSLFAAADLSITQHTEFLSTAYYTSMGFAIPASVGVQVANRDNSGRWFLSVTARFR
jgi:indolepyruvate decarboxylase